jgi:hypothetical protein
VSWRLEWLPFAEQQSRIYSYSGAFHHTANWSSIGFVAMLVILGGFNGPHRKRPLRIPVLFGAAAAAALGAGCILYLALSKTPVRLVSHHRIPTSLKLKELASHLMEIQDGATAEKVRQELKDYLTRPGPNSWDNELSGGAIREEDSPGNYRLGESAAGIEFIGYDAAGAPHLLHTAPR